MNDSSLALNTNNKLKEEIILYEESFLSRLYANKSESLISTNLYDSSCEEQDSIVIKEEDNNFSKNLKNFTRFYSEKDLEENTTRKTFGSSKRVVFNLDSNEIIGKDLIKKDKEIITRPITNRNPPLKKLESKSKSMKIFSRSIDDKFKNKASITIKKSLPSKYNSNEIKNKNLFLQKHEKYLERISSEGFGGQFTNTSINNPIRSFSSKVPLSKQKDNSKIKFNTFSNKTDNLVASIASSSSNTNQNNSFVNQIKNKLKKLLDNEYNSRLDRFSYSIMKLDENKEIIYKEKSHEIIKFIQALHEEKLKIILEIHKKFEDDLNKLENMLDPKDVNNISNKIYRFVYEDKQEELKKIELEFSEKKLKGLEEIEKCYEKISSKFSEKKIKKFQEFKKEFSEDLIIKIANFWGKKDNTNNKILYRTTHSLGNFSSNNNLSFENKKTLPKSLFSN